MRFVFSSCVVLALFAMAERTSATKPLYKVDEAPSLFEKFIKDFNKEYKDEADKQEHYEAFVKSLETINRLNSDQNQQTATYNINKFADYTEAEQKQMRGFKSQ